MHGRRGDGGGDFLRIFLIVFEFFLLDSSVEKHLHFPQINPRISLNHIDNV